MQLIFKFLIVGAIVTAESSAAGAASTQGMKRFAQTISFTMEFLRSAGQCDLFAQAFVVKMGRNSWLPHMELLGRSPRPEPRPVFHSNELN